MKITINALQYKQNSSGIGVMIRELYGAFVKLADRPCQVILPHDSIDFPKGETTQFVRASWKWGCQDLKGRIMIYWFGGSTPAGTNRTNQYGIGINRYLDIMTKMRVLP